MARAQTPRSGWTEQGLVALAAGGPDAVRIEALAKDLGVTKGGFYGYFDGRRALLDEMLETWEQTMVDEVIAAVESAGGSATAKLRRLFSIAGRDESLELLRVDLAIRDWARRDPGVAERLRRADNRRMEYMRSLFADLCDDENEVEVRCLLAFSLWIGNHFIAADHGSRSRGQVVKLALKRLES